MSELTLASDPEDATASNQPRRTTRDWPAN
jgi:hypothetical protein